MSGRGIHGDLFARCRGKRSVPVNHTEGDTQLHPVLLWNRAQEIEDPSPLCLAASGQQRRCRIGHAAAFWGVEGKEGLLEIRQPQMVQGRDHGDYLPQSQGSSQVWAVPFNPPHICLLDHCLSLSLSHSLSFSQPHTLSHSRPFPIFLSLSLSTSLFLLPHSPTRPKHSTPTCPSHHASVVVVVSV